MMRKLQRKKNELMYIDKREGTIAVKRMGCYL